MLDRAKVLQEVWERTAVREFFSPFQNSSLPCFLALPDVFLHAFLILSDRTHIPVFLFVFSAFSFHGQGVSWRQNLLKGGRSSFFISQFSSLVIQANVYAATEPFLGWPRKPH